MNGFKTITHQVQPDDVLWVFWSGYGVQIQREDGQNLDYLMPIDGDPEQIESTGIAATDLIDTLAGLPTDKTLLVLDINRSQGTLAGQSIGSQLIDLAEKRTGAYSAVLSAGAIFSWQDFWTPPCAYLHRPHLEEHCSKKKLSQTIEAKLVLTLTSACLERGCVCIIHDTYRIR